MASLLSKFLSRLSAGQKKAEPLAKVGEGSLRVSVISLQVHGALSPPLALASLKPGLSLLSQLLADRRSKGADPPSGTFALGFRTEPDGLIRMILENESTLTGDGAEELVQQFIGLAMSHQWRFVSSSGPSLVQVVFCLGE